MYRLHTGHTHVTHTPRGASAKANKPVRAYTMEARRPKYKTRNEKKKKTQICSFIYDFNFNIKGVCVCMCVRGQW